MESSAFNVKRSEGMDAIVSDGLPHFFQGLSQQIYLDRQEGKVPSLDGIRSLARGKSSTFRFPGQVKNTSVAALDAECELIALTRDLAAEAIRLYAGALLAARHTRRNQSSPTYRLPVEILSTIFELVRCTPANSLAPLERRAPLNLSGVSNFWRDVACNTPGLWTKIDAMNASLAPLFVQRSKRLPLQIEMVGASFYGGPEIDYDSRGESEDGSEDESEDEGGLNTAYRENRNCFSDFIRNLRPYVDRWESLTLQGIDKYRLRRALCSPAPYLEKFHVTHPGRTLGHEHDWDGGLFGGDTPRIRVLHIDAVFIPFNSSLYVGLTELHIESILYTESTTSDLLRCLQACPLLESLTLSQLLFPKPGTSTDSLMQPTASLRCLKYLNLYQLQRWVSDPIINSITAPSSVQLQFVQRCYTWRTAHIPVNIPVSPDVHDLVITRRCARWVDIIGNAVGDNTCLLKLEFHTSSPDKSPPLFL
ncbi:hypothetical protein BOTBODRAFT_611768 [Botryobasidium botryosum FD-172 SS1]|uniref:Uncharacterized protein n=1 Tax=Botryobasidium botryosum (strain FD-172 SS1) TaxID=930990 RepID=A0A067M5Z6_BOTB1|nr:hypothetical protein BOTBODRAFT_611768 [Botryobasidium botryosum FD-172 SS1]